MYNLIQISQIHIHLRPETFRPEPILNSDFDVANFFDFQDSTLLSFVFLTFDQTFRSKKTNGNADVDEC